MNIDLFLIKCRQVTDNYLNGGVTWDLKSQQDHIDEEVQELKDATNSLEELEEGWDVIFTVITYFHLKGFDDYAIKKSMQSTLKKIERRSEKYLVNNERKG